MGANLAPLPFSLNLRMSWRIGLGELWLILDNKQLLGHTFSDSVRCVHAAQKYDYTTNFKDIKGHMDYPGLIRKFSEIPHFK